MELANMDVHYASEKQIGMDISEARMISQNAPTPNSVVAGNSTDLIRDIPDESVHLVVTSPPYWDLIDYEHTDQIGHVTYEQYLDQMMPVWQECERVLVPNGKLCINAPIVPVPKQVDSSHHTRDLKNINSDIEYLILNQTHFRRYSLFVWQKQTTEKMFGSYPYPPNLYENNTIEFINVLVKPGKPVKRNPLVKEAAKLEQDEWMDLTRQIWWIYPEDVSRSGLHPAPFPELLPARLIKMYSFPSVDGNYEGDIVLDPFGGIGSTASAAKRLGRRYISIDLNPSYTEFAANRVNLVTEYPNWDIKLRRLSDGDQVSKLWN